MITPFHRWQEFHKASLNWTWNSRVFQTGIHKHSKFSAQNIIYRINCLNVYLKSCYSTYIDNHSLTLTWSEVWLSILSNIMRGLPDRSVGKDSWVRKICWRRDRPPTPVFLGSLVAQLIKNPHAVWETWVQSLGWKDPLDKGKAPHSSILAWKIPWTV